MENTTVEFKPRVVLPVLILGLSIIAASVVAAVAFYRVKALSNVISVTGSAEREISSDTVKWTSSISRVVEASALQAASAQMKDDLKTVRAYFISKGAKADEITVQPMTVMQVCSGQGNVMYDKSGGQYCGTSPVSGYNLQQTVVVESTNVDAITKLSQDAPGEFIGRGIVFTSVGVEYYYSQLAGLKLDMLAEATKDAKARAEKILSSTGSLLGALQSASMGVFQVTARNSTDISDYGMYDTTAIKKKVTAVVRASFLLK